MKAEKVKVVLSKEAEIDICVLCPDDATQEEKEKTALLKVKRQIEKRLNTAEMKYINEINENELLKEAAYGDYR